MKKILALFLTIILFVFLMSGCGTKKETSTLSENKKPLVINLEGGDWGYPSPYMHYPRGPGIFKMFLVFDSLLERGENGIIPWLAKDWEVSPDGKTYTFSLRSDVKWHDGKPMTAKDVKFSFEFFSKHIPVSDYLTVGGENIVESIKVTNDTTVQITSKTANASVLEDIGTVRIIPKHIWGNVSDPKKFNTPEAVIGCGPYVLKEYKKELGAYKFEAFKDYWGPQPLVDIINFIPVSDPLLSFNKGEIDLTRVPYDVLSNYQNSDEFKVLQNPGFWGYRIIFNIEKRPELNDKSLRQAIAYAINTNELIEKVERGAGIPASAGFLPKDHIWYNKNVKKYDFNIEKAKSLLDEKKYSFDLLVANRSNNKEVRIAELIKIRLDEIGININIKSVDMKTRDNAIKKKDFELAISAHGGWGKDPDVLRTHYGTKRKADGSPLSDGIPGYYNNQINNLCNKQFLEMDKEKRKQIVYKLQELISEEVPQLPLYNTTGYVVYRPSKYDGWVYMFDHHEVTHSKISYLKGETKQ